MQSPSPKAARQKIIQGMYWLRQTVMQVSEFAFGGFNQESNKFLSFSAAMFFKTPRMKVAIVVNPIRQWLVIQGSPFWRHSFCSRHGSNQRRARHHREPKRRQMKSGIRGQREKGRGPA